MPSPVGALVLADRRTSRFAGSARADVARLASSRWLRRLALGRRRAAVRRGELGQHNAYMRELYQLARALGVRVPIFHNDVHAAARAPARRATCSRSTATRSPTFRRDWRDDPRTFDEFAGDEAALDAHGRDANPVFYPELQGGWYDGWGGAGYARVRERLGADGIDATTKAALAARATLWNYYVFCGGSHLGLPREPRRVQRATTTARRSGESGATDARYEAVRRLNEFVAQLERGPRLPPTPTPSTGRCCPQHFATRLGARHRYVFLRNPTRARAGVAVSRAGARRARALGDADPCLRPRDAARSWP